MAAREMGCRMGKMGEGNKEIQLWSEEVRRIKGTAQGI